MIRYFYSTVFFLLVSFSSFAGSIRGLITDSKTNAPLIGVVITVGNTGKGTVSDIDGRYEVADIPAGNYEVAFTYATYATYRQSIAITANESQQLDVKMMSVTTELKSHVVKSTRITNTESAVINEIKSSSSVVSGTSAAQISKTMDRNAADVVKRIPGVTIQDDRFIVIRGLSDRYNSTWLNDAGTPSSEADKKSFSFDIIPAGLIDRIMIFKTPSPELPGDFAGGMVKVYTTSIADKNQVAVGLQLSSREYTTGNTFNYSTPSKTDWLGYDDGKRNIPSVIPAFISNKDPNYNANIGAWSKSFGNDWILSSTKTNPDMRFSLAMSNVVKLKKVKIGNTLGIAYSNTYTNYDVQRQEWDSIAKNYNYHDLRSANNISAGIMDNIGVAIGNSKIEFKNLYNQIGSALTVLRTSVRDTMLKDYPDEKQYMLGYESRATYASQLSGTHKNKTDTRQYNWTLGYSDLFKNQPDRRIIKYFKKQSDTLYNAIIPVQGDILSGGRFYAALYEHNYSFNHQFSQKFSIKKQPFEVLAGNYVELKRRSLNIRELGYGIKTGAYKASYVTRPLDQIFADSNVDGGAKGFKINDLTKDYDHYDAENKLVTGFVALRFPIRGHVNVSGGVRYESNEQDIKYSMNNRPVEYNIKTNFLLPSVNLSYNFSEKSLIRAAYGKTLNRPEFREWASIFYYDFDELSGNKGSMFPTNANVKGAVLKVCQIQNVDVRYELYPSAGEMIHVGAFYKLFQDPIQRILIPGSSSGDNRTYTFINAKDAFTYGLEIDVRKNLAFVDEKFGTHFFNELAIVGNLSLVKSEQHIDTSKKTGIVDGLPRSTVQGQSPYVVNTGIYYQGANNGFQGSLLYNVFGPRLYAVGTNEAGSGSIGEMPFQSLDMALSKLFRKHYMISFGIQNMLGSRVVFMKDINKDTKFSAKDDREVKTYYPGRYYTVGVKIKF